MTHALNIAARPRDISTGLCALEEHERVAQQLHALVWIDAKQNNPVTEGLATARSAFHQKAAGMLKALVA
ncbi:hypothetical protein [Yoonia sediminilitoris]|uniref:Uncharacterized protein n=1 Tax=Yoonia sediminilitoris TaxID=1286148 RepID=A0A2T6KHC2_9RHOB|nr:hypothetical protein [Yoonia sediminilitoris]PUB14919.1 hypothetical protein C8N45_105142 [Yoonia sediminilitoris]RCW95636.1 hypothetical protein DFP92_105142 [Yoonia sediminilitoris]